MRLTQYVPFLLMLLLLGGCNNRQAIGETEPEVLPPGMYRGTLVLAPRLQVFIPCGSERPFWIDGVTTELRAAYRTQQSDGEYQPVYMVVEGDVKASRVQPFGQALDITTVFESKATIPEDCQTAGSGLFEANGNEPGWHLTIDPDKDRITLVSQYGEKKVIYPYFPPVPWGSDRTYYTNNGNDGPLIIEVFRQECTDNMSGQKYTHSVEIKTAETVLQGCGGKKGGSRE